MEAFRTRPLDAGPYTFVAADALVLKVRENGRAVAQSNWTYYDCPRPDSETVAQCRLALGVVPDGERVRGIDTQTGRTRPILAIRVLERGLDRVPHARSLASPLGAAAAAISASHAVSADGHNSCSMQIGSASYYSSSTGVGTIVTADSIDSHCWVNEQVTSRPPRRPRRPISRR